MLYEENPSDTSLTDEDINKLIKPELFNSPKAFSSRDAASTTQYAEPISGGMQYRGWYGQASGKSNWKPQSSRWHGRGGKHKGLDLFCHSLTPLYAAVAGNAEYNDTRNPTGWGNFIMLYFQKDGTNYIAVYAHLDASSKFAGTKAFTAGAQIGLSGCSGNAGKNGICHRNFRCSEYTCIEDHLHLELLKLKTGGFDKINPQAFFGWGIKFENDNTNELCSEANLQYQTVGTPA